MDKIRFFKQYILSGSVFITGIIVSVVIHTLVLENKSNQSDIAFKALASNCANAIVEGFSHTLFAIESVGALYGSSQNISFSQFDAFVTPLLERFPTITALSWVPLVNHNEREDFERTARQLFPGFRITESDEQNEIVNSTTRQIYFPVYFIRPYEGNEAAQGFDLYSNPVRRAAIDHASDSTKTTSTARLRLVQENGDQHSVLIIHPVFHHSISAKDQRKLMGVASAVYRIGDGVEKALSHVHSDGLNIWLFDRSSEPDKQFLYLHTPEDQETKKEEMETMLADNTRKYVHEFKLGERNFELILTPASDYFTLDEGYDIWLPLILGLGFTSLLAAYLSLIRRRSQELAAGQQVLEQQINERVNAEKKLREANQSLEELSRKDHVMGLANRRYFDEHLQNEWLRATRDGTSLSLLIGDVDFFKAYNDTYGHVAGDKCLQIIAKILSDVVDRPGDLPARYGGEEIAVILPSTSEAGAYKIAESIRLAIAEMALPHEQSPIAKVVSMSIGCGTALPKQGSSMENFIRAVDDALYCAKQKGRNQTVVAE
ncbi:diguanylate cyclase domain-containing protein [Nitrosomonas marina]|uniref:diguanylate cyclase n=1 Tax=Nitrosomonas marina TaxID=917 RepID=A0A1H8IF32_9PROT|nr:diguanylate cyclase [Nitrosomonas marina]SEN67333.1 diguanylate cyclase (GGDEF) domain-containing protein [Nitrosomonas marina]